MSIDDVLARLSVIEAKVDRLLAGVAAPSAPTGEAFPDARLSEVWADKEIKKDPPRYSGPTMVGRRFSTATAEWHETNASYLDWKAQKGREETPVRLNNKGKPWHESDTFEAKLCRAWAKRLRAGSAAPASGSDDIPF